MAQLGGALLALLIPAIMLAIVIGIALDARNYVFNKMLRKVAKEIDGTFMKGGALQPPTIRLAVGGVPALVAFWVGPQRTEPVGTFQVRRSPDVTGVVEVEDKLWGNRMGGPPRVSIGETDFEERFRIYATSAADASMLVREPLRRALDKLAVMGKVRAAFRSKLIEISVRAEDWDTFTIRQFIDLAVEAARPGLGPASVAAGVGEIQWIDEAEPDALMCQVCASGLDDPVVRCRRCRAPHHEQCWEYTGICATFACGCRKFKKTGFLE